MTFEFRCGGALLGGVHEYESALVRVLKNGGNCIGRGRGRVKESMVEAEADETQEALFGSFLRSTCYAIFLGRAVCVGLRMTATGKRQRAMRD